jgi:hypothetical protein
MSNYLRFDRLNGLRTDHQRRVAEVIRDVYPTIALKLLDPLHPSFTPEKPFALEDQPDILPPYIIRTLAESEIDHRLLAWLMDNDLANSNSKANRLELLEMSEALMRAKSELDWEEERKDMMRSMLKSGKHEYRHGGKTLRK